jgi:hypothetical protein
MASTYSDLKFELIGTGDQAGTWGITTNNNIGGAIEEAITGSGFVSFSGADVTLTLTNTNATQTARNLRLNLTGTSGGARSLIVPAIQKQYIVSNGLADPVTIKNSTGTGVIVPTGKTMVVFNDATNVVDVTTHATSLTISTPLPVTSGGSGATTLTGLLQGNGTSAFSVAPTTGSTTGIVMLSVDPTITNYTESVVTIGTVTTAHTLSLTTGTVQTATLTASTACVFTMPSPAAGKSFILLLKQAAATGNGTATFTGVKFNSAGTPIITATAGKMDILAFVSDGTNWYGSITQGFTP